MSVFYGIVFDIDTIKAIFKAMKRGTLRNPDLYTLNLLEEQIHSRTECESFADTLERCKGFLGIVRSAITTDELEAFKPTFHRALDENRELLRELGVRELTPALRGGISHGLYLPGDEYESVQSSDEESGSSNSMDDESDSNSPSDDED